MLLLCYQTAQLTHVINERLKETTEDAEREKALKDIVIATIKEKGKAAEAIEKKAQFAEKARLVVEKKLTELEVKLGGTELKLVEAESLNLVQADEIADPKAALEACEESGTMKALQMLKTPWSPFSIKPDFMDSRRGGWQPCKQCEWPRIPY